MSVKISGTASLLGSDYYLERRGVSRDLVAFVNFAVEFLELLAFVKLDH